MVNETPAPDTQETVSATPADAPAAPPPEAAGTGEAASAEAAPAEAAPTEAADDKDDKADDERATLRRRPATPGGGDIAFELGRLVELSVKYPEIGPTVAELAFRLGKTEFADRIVRMGLGQDTPGLEFYFVAAGAARREGRHADTLSLTLDAVKRFQVVPDATLAADDGTRLLHLVRLAFATLMFDVKDVAAFPDFTAGLLAALPALEGRLGADPFFHVMRAQTLWVGDKAASEAAWEQAVALGEAEHTWNARGTWYKEAERDLDKAEKAYRAGLNQVGRSALLMHNLAQILLDKAALDGVEPGAARRLCNQADEILRMTLREDMPKGLRRHVHATRDRLNELRSSLPPPPPRGERRGGQGAPKDDNRGNQRDAGAADEPNGNLAEPGNERPRRPPREAAPVEPPPPPAPPPEVGAVLTGRVVSLTDYGVFVAVGGGHVGLLHKTELSWEPVGDPASVVKQGDEFEVKVLDVGPGKGGGGGGKLRIGLSRKALLPRPAQAPRPAGPPRRDDRGGGGGQRRDDRGGGGGRRDDRAAGGRDDRGPRRDDRGPRRDDRPPPGPPLPKFPTDGRLASLGEMLLKKMHESAEKAERDKAAKAEAAAKAQAAAPGDGGGEAAGGNGSDAS